MKASINREEFIRRLESVRPGLAKREIVEQATNFIFKGGGIFTFNEEVACKAPSGLDKSITGAVPADPLINQLSKWAEDEIGITVTNGELVVSGKGRQAGFRMESEVTLPVGSVEKVTDWTPLPDGFLEACGTVGLCASTDQSRFELTCVHLAPDYIEAWSRFQIARWPIKTGLEKSVLVRQSALKSVVSAGVTHYSETNNWLHFKAPSKLVISCRRYLDDYPDPGKFLDVTGGSARFPKGLVEACTRAEVFTSENADSNLVEVDLKPGKLSIKGTGSRGWYKELKKLSYDGPAVSFLTAPKLLAELVTKHDECVVSPARLKVDAGRYIYVAALHVPQGNGQLEKKGGKNEEPQTDDPS